MIIPRNVVLSDRANSAKIMNYIRQNANSAYRRAVPIAEENAEGVRAVGEIILGDENLYNAFVPALLNRIGRVTIMSKLYHNTLAQFKLGYMEMGDIYEEIFVNLIDPHAFDPEQAEETWMRREKPNVDAIFHRINFQAFYKITISYNQLRAAFLTWSGLHDLVGRIIEQVYTSANWDEFIMFKYLIASALIKKQMYPVEIPVPTADNAKQVTSIMVEVSNNLLFMGSSFNPMGVTTYTDKDSQIMLINTKFAAIQDVEVLASAFNMDKAQLQGRVVLINGFNMTPGEMERLKKLEKIIGTPYPQFSEEEQELLENIPAVLVDESFFIVLDQLFEMRNAENGEGLYWQYWLHTWKMFSWSPFANAIAFTTETTEITGITLSPTTATINKGDTKLFTANVTGTGIFPVDGVWTLTAAGNTPVKSTVTKNGLVTISIDETNTSLTLHFISSYDYTKSATATITVK